ncbi:hypothetical protein [Phnomibacter sp. MR]
MQQIHLAILASFFGTFDSDETGGVLAGGFKQDVAGNGCSNKKSGKSVG